MAKEFAVLGVEDLLTKDIDELRQQAMEARGKMQDTIRGEGGDEGTGSTHRVARVEQQWAQQ
jgi:hypothetical protein